MKTVGIITNSDKDINFEYTFEIAHWLKSQGINPIISEEISANSGDCYERQTVDGLCKKSDFVVVLGGDGTMLRASSKAAINNVPIMGINLGNLGYLTDASKEDGISALKKVINNNYKIEKRMMIEAEITDDDGNLQIFTALNDICILRGGSSKVINLDINVNNQYMDTLKADGMIISTPTGSTAYNLSAGGPVFKPDIELIAITPVCPHNIHSRPSVISCEDVVSVKVGSINPGNVILSYDGQEYGELKPGQIVNIRKSKLFTMIIKTNDLGFYDILRLKFHN